MTIRILTGDMRELLAEIPDGSVDCVVTDPPYGETSLAWDRRVLGWPAMVLPKLKPSGSMWLFGSLRLLMAMSAEGEFVGWTMSQDVVWEKHNGTGMQTDRFRRVHELAVHFYPASSPWKGIFKSPQFTNDARERVIKKSAGPAHWNPASGQSVYRSVAGGPRLMRSVQMVRSEHGRAEHPTQKPLGILEPLIRYSCPLDGALLDPFAGSGTVGLLASRIGIACTLIEGDPKFADIIRRRLGAELLQGLEAAE